MDRRRLVIVVTVGALALMAYLGAGRFTSPSATGQPDAAAPLPPERDASTSDLPRTGAAASEPAAYPQTAEGAVAAATAYGLALDGPALFDPAHRSRVLDEIAAEEAREELATTFADGAELISSQLGINRDLASDPGFVWRVVPGGWQLRGYDRSSATVAIWAAVVVMVDDRLLVEPGWQTSEVQLSWERDGWRLVGFRTEPGPNPVFATGPGVDPVGQRINEFAPFRYWPDEPHGEGNP